MMDNVHGDKDKTPSPSGRQNIMLHAIYSTRALPRNIEKIPFYWEGPGFEIAICNSQFAKCFGSFQWVFAFF